MRLSKATKEINLGKYNDFILPAWNGQMMQMYPQVLNRHQDNLTVYRWNDWSKIVLNEKIKHIDVDNPFLNDNSFIGLVRKTVLITSIYMIRTENYAIK
jgi:hypothetical protein